MEKDWQGYHSYKCNLEIAKKVHESLKKREKDYDIYICWNDWVVLRMDDCDMTGKSEISFILNIGSFVL